MRPSTASQTSHLHLEGSIGGGPYVSRIELNSAMKVVQSKCNDSCRCAKNWRFMIRDMSTVAKCLFPSHTWDLQVSVGMSLENRNSVTDEVGVSVGISKGPLTVSARYKNISQSTNSVTWSREVETTEEWSFVKGQSRSSWRLTLTCKAFNRHNFYINELRYRTRVTTETGSSAPPACDPLNPLARDAC
ncbi:unnamed protein product [Polarella glacialis]|uniref:Uncharacterized protein n=1 Tax=Polarella glacialis TaxID=89957 RepID=A0A813KED7_POLGL|nr:unnamed protein product [Polarella glacialis]